MLQHFSLRGSPSGFFSWYHVWNYCKSRTNLEMPKVIQNAWTSGLDSSAWALSKIASCSSLHHPPRAGVSLANTGPSNCPRSFSVSSHVYQSLTWEAWVDPKFRCRLRNFVYYKVVRCSKCQAKEEVLWNFFILYLCILSLLLKPACWQSISFTFFFFGKSLPTHLRAYDSIS